MRIVKFIRSWVIPLVLPVSVSVALWFTVPDDLVPVPIPIGNSNAIHAHLNTQPVSLNIVVVLPTFFFLLGVGGALAGWGDGPQTSRSSGSGTADVTNEGKKNKQKSSLHVWPAACFTTVIAMVLSGCGTYFEYECGRIHGSGLTLWTFLWMTFIGFLILGTPLLLLVSRSRDPACKKKWQESVDEFLTLTLALIPVPCGAYGAYDKYRLGSGIGQIAETFVSQTVIAFLGLILLGGAAVIGLIIVAALPMGLGMVIGMGAVNRIKNNWMRRHDIEAQAPTAAPPIHYPSSKTDSSSIVHRPPR